MSEGKLYKFISKSQHILQVMYLGRKYKIKFSTPYNGVSRYSTSDEQLAAEIRATESFKHGMIQELESVELNPKVEVKQISETKAKKADKPKDKPSWMNGSMSRVGVANAAGGNATGRIVEEVEDKQDECNTERSNANDGNTTGSIVEDAEMSSLFPIKLEEIDNWMDAKAYLTDVIGVKPSLIKTKELAKNYCADNSIVFPNYTFK